MRIFSGTTNFDFLGARRWAYLLSLVLVAFSVFMWISQGDAKYSVEFKGGQETIVKIDDPEAGSESIRAALAKEDLDDVAVQAFEAKSREFAIRTGAEVGGREAKNKVQDALEKAFPGKVEVLRNEFIGPVIGAELRRQAVWATIFGWIAILLYVTFRFEFAFALGGVVALVHDVLVATGVYLFFGHQINMATLAGALTIIGYSINDTVVVFDRIREEVLKRKGEPFEDVINYSVNVTLSRTLITSLLTLFTVVALFLFGPRGSIEDLSLFLIAGMISGTYSTIYVASPVALAWSDWQNRREKRKAEKA